jgi:hypothetical protein
MKNLLIFIFIVYFTRPVSGQISTGISTGPGFSTMSVHLRDLSTFRIRPVVGYNINFIVEFRLDSSLSISSGLSFSQKGFRQTLYYQYSPFTSAEMAARLNYLEIPLYLKVNTGIKKIAFFYGAGPFFSYGLAGHVSTESTQQVDLNYTDEIKWAKSVVINEDDLPDSYGYTSIKRFDWGIGTIAGLKYRNLFLTIDYRYSLRNIMWEYFPDEKMSNSILALSVGYTF